MAAATPAASEVRVDTVENDDVIAYALQEELAQVAMAEAFGADGGEAEQRATVLAGALRQPPREHPFPSSLLSVCFPLHKSESNVRPHKSESNCGF